MYSSPVRHSPPGYCYPALPFDLHVLGMPPAFNLSQDQTLHFELQASTPKGFHQFRKSDPSKELLFLLGAPCIDETFPSPSGAHTSHLRTLS